MTITQNLTRYNRHPRRAKKSSWSPHFALVALLFALCLATFVKKSPEPEKINPFFGHLPPLAMEGGDPYIRALMRTISASESNGKNPYILLYGGQHIHDLSHHPNTCIPIKTKVNQGLCSTAAGRYQFLTKTWQEKAALYHPQRQIRKINYSFDPESQDLVTYRWLMDQHHWGIDLSTQLQKGQVEEVLKKLSPTWTSLGHGIEDNIMTASLPTIYQKLLAEELAQAN
ncbi:MULTISPECIES: glycoside hydrolase family protein [unclassified Synechocystis]|uniref:glycoside hydrolase family 24 protein n=1 Tax=unclassified Synechocystis TaxID=2640012 RepID=UPI0003FAA553|nr:MULTISPECIES: glycoside hydrolase family protein [unclassified Synechocystis]AIE76297.1 Muramidase (phage lambda lysozyme) [Synechocystis sp. PCC 6714]QUS60892.1 glycoside hydrolase family protein [Synechocystis sp. PCC 7338]